METASKKESISRTLNWMKCLGNVWCKLSAVNLDHRHFNDLTGVYIVWHAGPNPHVVYIGHGIIRDRLLKHRTDERIQQYADLDLFVTWARVDEPDHEGVEAYLAEKWQPKVGERHPQSSPIQTNSPW